MNAPDEKRRSWLWERGNATFIIMAGIVLGIAAIPQLGEWYREWIGYLSPPGWRVVLGAALVGFGFVVSPVVILGFLGIPLCVSLFSILWRHARSKAISRRGLIAYLVGMPLMLGVWLWSPVDMRHHYGHEFLHFHISVGAIALGVVLSGRLWRERLKLESLSHLSFWCSAALMLAGNVVAVSEHGPGMGFLPSWLT